MKSAPRKRDANRIARRVLLGALLLIVALYWLVQELDLDVDVLMDYLVASALLVVGAMVLALIGAGLMRLVSRKDRR